MSTLPSFKRLITGHKNGKAVLLDSIDVDAKFELLPAKDAAFSLGYITKQFPVDLNDEADIKVYSDALLHAPGLVNQSGTIMRFVDIGPGVTSAMHRTVSCDYGIVLLGEIELILDSGERSLMKPGDVCIQRGTMHAWRNASSTEWGRMVYFLHPCLPIKTEDGERLQEEYGGLQGVPPSS